MAPTLSLSYSSQSGNGMLGVGWSLGGLSNITRCGQTLAQDNKISAINFTTEDRFCIDGKRLIAISGVYGANGTEYRTEIETYARIISYGSAGTGPAQFKVWTKSGQIIEYGFSNDARIEAQGRADAMIWAVNKISDTVGNYLSVSYFEDNANGHYRVDRIDYTGNSNTGLAPNASVRFVYEDRTDKTTGYVAGTKTTSPVRMASVQTYVGENSVKNYRFTYEYGAATQKSRLVKLLECDSGGTICKAASSFQWNEKQSGFKFGFQQAAKGHMVDGDGNTVATKIIFSDFNGDGFTDIAALDVGAPYYGRYVHVCYSTGSGFNCSYQQLLYTDVGVIDKAVGGDFNGDGLADMAMLGSGGLWTVCYSTGSGFNCNYPAYSGGSSSIFPGDTTSSNFVSDFNGDGRADIAFYSTSSGSEAWNVCYSTGRGFNCSYQKVYVDGRDSSNHVVGDFNGDGLSDIAAFSDPNQSWFVCYSTGIGFSCGYQQSLAGKAQYTAGDFNGDGLSDMAVYSNNLIGGNWRVCYATGTGFNCSNQQSFAGSSMVSDFNGDGLSDMGGYAGGSTLQICLSTGSAFSCSSQQTTIGNSLSQDADFNGDGLPDLVEHITGDLWQVGYSNGPKADHMVSVTDGLGDQVKVTYKPLTDKSVYTKHTDAVYPVTDVQGPMYVVSSFERADGLGGFYTFNYQYEGMKAQVLGRGSLGFRKVTTSDARTGMKTVTTYNQNWPSNGLPELTQTYLADGTLLDNSSQTYQVVDLGAGRRAVHATVSDKKTYELNGVLITQITSTNSYDEFGNALNVVVDYHDGFRKETASLYTNDTSNWFLGRLTRASVTNYIPSGAFQTRTSSFAYNLTTGLLNQETLEPDNTTLRLTTDYTHDAYGNKITSAVSGPGITARTSKTVFDARGLFPVSISNALNQSETTTWDARYGVKVSSTGPNGLTTQWLYDSLGRLIKEIRADGTESSKTYSLCTLNCDAGAPLSITTQSTGSVPTSVFFDALGREIKTTTQGFDGRVIQKITQYDQYGRVANTTLPHYQGDIAHTASVQFDVLGRVTKEIQADGSATSITYGVLTTTHTNNHNQTSTKIKNSQGQLIKAIDAAGSFNTYEYDPFGNMTRVTDAQNNATTLSYNIRGHKTAMVDPNMGSWTYTYDTLGQLLTQKDAKAQSVTLQYDLLGRLIKRTEPEGISTWVYDTAPKGIGKLAKATGPDGFTETHTYDSLGRPSSSASVINAQTHTQTVTYDTLSRPATTKFPSGFIVKNVYNQFGFLNDVQNGAGTVLYWRAITVNARGQTTQELLGNGLSTVRGYDDKTGRIQSVNTGNGTIQNLSYQFDTLGNLTERRDLNQTLTESFNYDNLNRLTNANLSSGSIKSYQYDKLGNITYKSDVGSYLYQRTNGAGPNAVTEVTQANGTKLTYGYDKNGNQVSGDGRTLTYTSFNKPKTVKKGTTTNTYYYGVSRERTRKTNQATISGKAVTTTTVYLGKAYEQVAKSNTNVIEYKHYIGAGGTTVLYTQRSNNTNETRYLHQDHLGSTDAISDHTGKLVERASFDPWGQRRNPNWQSTTTIIASLTTKGFTGHEQEDEVGLINMNARLYDPKLGRFLQPDTYIQFPETTQGFNRYTYVNNNPLSYTDPTGNWLQYLFMAIKIIAGKMTLVNALIALAKSYIISQVVGRVIKNPYWASFAGSILGGGGGYGGGIIGDAALSTAIGANKRLSTVVSVLTFFAEMREPDKTRGTADDKLEKSSENSNRKTGASSEENDDELKEGERRSKGKLYLFNDQDAAARHALSWVNPLSIDKNLEYGGLIYRTREGWYGYTDIIEGDADGMNARKLFAIPIPAGATMTGFFHTHGDYSYGEKSIRAVTMNSVYGDKNYDEFNSDNHSPADKDSVMRRSTAKPDFRSYLGTPSGVFKVYNPHDPEPGNKDRPL